MHIHTHVHNSAWTNIYVCIRRCWNKKDTIFLDAMPCSSVGVRRLFGGTYLLYFKSKNKPKKEDGSWDEQVFASLFYFSALKMEAVSFSEISVNLYRWNIAEDCTAHRHRCQNFKCNSSKSAVSMNVYIYFKICLKVITNENDLMFRICWLRRKCFSPG